MIEADQIDRSIRALSVAKAWTLICTRGGTAEDQAFRERLQTGMGAECALLRCGQSSAKEIQQRAFEQVVERGRHVIRGDRTLADDPLSSEWPLEILEDHPVIDLRILARRGQAREGERTWFSLVWPMHRLESLSVIASVDLTTPGGGLLILIFRGAKGVVHQQFNLWPRKSGQHRYRVESAEGPVELLAYRNGRFASRRLQRLVNRSQRKLKAPVPCRL